VGEFLAAGAQQANENERAIANGISARVRIQATSWNRHLRVATG